MGLQAPGDVIETEPTSVSVVAAAVSWVPMAAHRHSGSVWVSLDCEWGCLQASCSGCLSDCGFENSSEMGCGYYGYLQIATDFSSLVTTQG